ncbi:hypothetical protein SFRURICE_018366 [Spodoptera frugiperda]|nr:hypothetical protein SFRURICE_018366 [Spodoptera frugiperda]
MWSAKKCSDNNASTPSAEEEIKVVLVGDTQCGKTSLVQRFVSDTFIEDLVYIRLVRLAHGWNVSYNV